MRYSLFFNLQLADPTPESERAIVHDAVEQAVMAEKLGYDGIWVVEHHGLYEYSHCSSPESILAFIAAKTERIKLGHGITLTPYRYNHPIRIAERVAMLDVLSNGRVIWGSGKSSSMTELGAFENDITMVHDQWLEALEIIPQMWRDEVFEHYGRFFEIPPTQVVPKPVQAPHPPIVAACSRKASAVLAGEMGVGALNFAVGTAEALREKVDAYRAAVSAAQPEHYGVTNHYACAPLTFCSPDDRQAVELGWRGARFFEQGLATYFMSGTRPLGPLPIPRGPLSTEEIEQKMQSRNSPEEALYLIGEPARLIDTIHQYADTGVDELILVMQMGTIPLEEVHKSMRVFAESVLPHVPHSESMVVGG